MRKLLLLTVLAALAALGSITLAGAHSRPVRFDPSPGAVLTEAPAEVHGWFTDAIRKDSSWAYIHVMDAQGNRVDTGTTDLSADRLQEMATLKSGLGEGMYTVEWRTFDDTDGAIFGDCYNFFVGQAAADDAATNGTRLDAGDNCGRIDFENDGSTPTPSELATVTAPPVEGADTAASDAGTTSSGSSGVPVWSLVVGIIGGVVVGGAGGRFVSGKSKS